MNQDNIDNRRYIVVDTEDCNNYLTSYLTKLNNKDYSPIVFDKIGDAMRCAVKYNKIYPKYKFRVKII